MSRRRQENRRHLAITSLLGVSLLLGYAFSQSPAISPAGCPALLDSLRTLLADNDPAFLMMEINDSSCLPEEKQEAYYQQAMGSLLLGNHADAKLLLHGALAYPGPYRDSAWYLSWRVSRELGEETQAEAAMLQLFEESPASPHLSEMLSAPSLKPRTETPAVMAAKKRPWSIRTFHALSATHDPDYHRDLAENRLLWQGQYVWKDHGFSPSVQAGVTHDLIGPQPRVWEDIPELSALSGMMSLGYMHGWFFANASAGVSYDFLRKSFAGLSGAGTGSFVGWNVPQGGLLLGTRIPWRQDRGSSSLYVMANRFHRSMSQVSLDGSSALHWGTWTHSVSASAERLYLETPVSIFQDTLFVLPAPLRNTQVSDYYGDFAYEGLYSVENRQPKWRTTFSVAYRQEKQLIRQATDSLVLVDRIDTTQTFSEFLGDAPATEQRLIAHIDIHAALTPHFSLNTSLRSGYLWVTCSDKIKEREGMVFRGLLSLTTTF